MMTLCRIRELFMLSRLAVEIVGEAVKNVKYMG